MKLLIFSDIHGDKAALERLMGIEADYYIAAGDLANWGRGLDQMARELLAWDPFFGGRQASAFVPAFEVKETNEAFVLKADIPGVAESDIDIAVHNNILTISGTRNAEERKEGDSFALYERQYGSFSRSFS